MISETAATTRQAPSLLPARQRSHLTEQHAISAALGSSAHQRTRRGEAIDRRYALRRNAAPYRRGGYGFHCFDETQDLLLAAINAWTRLMAGPLSGNWCYFAHNYNLVLQAASVVQRATHFFGIFNNQIRSQLKTSTQHASGQFSVKSLPVAHPYQTTHRANHKPATALSMARQQFFNWREERCFARH